MHVILIFFQRNKTYCKFNFCVSEVMNENNSAVLFVVITITIKILQLLLLWYLMIKVRKQIEIKLFVYQLLERNDV